LDIFFQESSGVPLPPDEIRIREFSIKDWLDKDRLKVHIEIDPFQQRPNLDVQILSLDKQQEFASTSIIGVMTQITEITIHFRGSHPPSEYVLRTILYYTPNLTTSGEISAEENSFFPTIVDRKDIIFTST
jgi:hypothetical protein